MGANTAYWQVRYADGEHTVIGYKSTADPTPDPADDTVRFRDLGRPECELLGVQYENSWSTDAVVRSYGPVTEALGHPWFAGSGFAPGETSPRTVGYEWDFVTPGCDHPPLTQLFHWDDGPGGLPPADAVEYTAPSGARVFSTGSMQFAWDLDGDGAFDDGAGAVATTTFPVAGTRTVRLRATDDDGASAIATRTVVVAAAPSAGPPPASPPPVGPPPAAEPVPAAVPSVSGPGTRPRSPSGRRPSRRAWITRVSGSLPRLGLVKANVVLRRARRCVEAPGYVILRRPSRTSATWRALVRGNGPVSCTLLTARVARDLGLRRACDRR